MTEKEIIAGIKDENSIVVFTDIDGVLMSVTGIDEKGFMNGHSIKNNAFFFGSKFILDEERINRIQIFKIVNKDGFMEKKFYTIQSANCIDDEVNEALKNGYKLHGEMTTVRGLERTSNGHPYIQVIKIQAVVKG